MAVALGFDSSVLSPFARVRRLDVLERITRGHPCVVTRAVLDELDRGSDAYPGSTPRDARTVQRLPDRASVDGDGR